MDVKLTKIEGRKANDFWDEKHDVAIRHVAALEAIGYIVAVRRTPTECDVAHFVNFDIVLCDLPYIDPHGYFDDRKYYAETGSDKYRLHQFHLATNEMQIQQLSGMVGQRITLRGLSSTVCWEHEERGVGGIYCRSREFLNMVESAGIDDYELGAKMENEGYVHCHVLINPRWEVNPSLWDLPWDACVAVVKSPVTVPVWLWKSVF